MQKLILFIGSVFILFSFMLVGLGACTEDPDLYDDDDDTTSCPTGYTACDGIDKCCPSGYPYHGNNGNCYTTLASCKQKTTGCTQCGNGGSSGQSWSCSSGYCLARLSATSYVCCPSSYPRYGGSKCWKTTSDALANGVSTTYGCSKYF